jgi:cyclophilin family peptidyl-prolyl cis-trans isomerase
MGALAVLALAASSARAETKLEVTAAAAKAEVTVGDDIEVNVTVKNAGDAEVEATELSFDARSVSFEVKVDDGKVAWDTQFHMKPQGWMELTSLKRKGLKAGESWTQSFTIPAVASGSWSVTGVYAGSIAVPDALTNIDHALVKTKSAAVTVKVNPTAAGETNVQARVNTTLGTVTINFFPKDALGSAINFVRIARSGFYDGKTFHRIDKGLGVIQGGAAKPDGSGEFLYCVPRELGLKHGALRVGMARSGDPNSGSSQFYICANDSPKTLDGPDGYAVFAEVVKGKDVVDALFAVETKGTGANGNMAEQAPKKPLKIESVKLQLAP